MMNTQKEKVTIKIPKPLYKNLSEIIEGSGFNSVTEFVVYVLRDLISSRTVQNEPSLSKKEIEIVKKRLKSLGYL
jgi:metal-responsive CopG/Arc/MetJ family transcriptional regulator